MPKYKSLISKERVYVFIDGSNLYMGMKEFIGKGPFPPYSINKLSQYVCANRRLVRILYYNSPLHRENSGYRKQQQFFDGLRKISYLDLKLGRLAKRNIRLYCSFCKNCVSAIKCSKCRKNFDPVKYFDKGTDVHIATDLLIHAFDDQFDTAILISEDGDFASAIQEVQRLKKKVENVYFRKRYLAQICDKFTLLNPKIINSLRPEK